MKAACVFDSDIDHDRIWPKQIDEAIFGINDAAPIVLEAPSYIKDEEEPTLDLIGRDALEATASK